MERRLSRFIPLIRFYNIPTEDFLSKVHPFKELLSNDLINNIIAYNKSPDTNSIQVTQLYRINSGIIKSQHFNIFASWIEKKDKFYYNKRKNPYKIQLLYRASRDGDTVTRFHEKCDNKGPTLVITRIANSEHIIGGYNPLDWKPVLNECYKSTKDSFIFSFKDRNNLQTAKVSYPNDEKHQYSIVCYSGYGPTFGNGHELGCYGNGNWASHNLDTYPKINIPSSFKVNDYEVFQVI